MAKDYSITKRPTKPTRSVSILSSGATLRNMISMYSQTSSRFRLRFPNLHNLSVENLYHSLCFQQSCFTRVSNIFFMRHPLQIFNKVISLHSIFMVHCFFVFRIFKKRLRDEAVNFFSFSFLVLTNTNQQVTSSVFTAFKNFFFTRPSISTICESLQTLHSTKIRDFIKSLVPFDWLPDFFYHCSELMRLNLSKSSCESKGFCYS